MRRLSLGLLCEIQCFRGWIVGSATFPLIVCHAIQVTNDACEAGHEFVALKRDSSPDFMWFKLTQGDGMQSVGSWS